MQCMTPTRLCTIRGCCSAAALQGSFLQAGCWMCVLLSYCIVAGVPLLLGQSLLFDGIFNTAPPSIERQGAGIATLCS